MQHTVYVPHKYLSAKTQALTISFNIVYNGFSIPYIANKENGELSTVKQDTFYDSSTIELICMDPVRFHVASPLLITYHSRILVFI